MKFALCIGINDYPGTNSDLNGCVNDANDWAAELGKRDFDVRLLLDAEATGEAMRGGIRERLAAAGSGDAVVITYSGHGTWVPDRDGDEPDRRDEALCPHDISANGPLLDDELFDLFSERRRGTRVILISDSCHSGSVAKYAPATGTGSRRIRFLAPGVFLRSARRRRRAGSPAPTGAGPGTRLCCSPAARTSSTAMTRTSATGPTARSPTWRWPLSGRCPTAPLPGLDGGDLRGAAEPGLPPATRPTRHQRTEALATPSLTRRPVGGPAATAGAAARTHPAPPRRPPLRPPWASARGRQPQYAVDQSSLDQYRPDQYAPDQ